MLLDELGSYLETAHPAAVTVGTNLFLGLMPTEPATAAALLDYEGGGWIQSQDDDGAETAQARVQLLTRAPGYEASRDLCTTLMKTLHRINNETIGAAFYQRVVAISPPFQLDRDDNGRVLFAVNFEVTKELE